MIYQKKAYNCGPTAVAYLMERFGLKVDPDNLEIIAKTDVDEGTTFEGMEEIFKVFGMGYKTGKCTDILTLPLPSIVCHTPTPESHYVVIETLVDGCVHFYDPTVGNIYAMAQDRFMETWKTKWGDNW